VVSFEAKYIVSTAQDKAYILKVDGKQQSPAILDWRSKFVP